MYPTVLCHQPARALCILLAVFAIAFTCNAAELRPYQGASHPDFTLKDLAGHSHTLSTLKGKVVVVSFLRCGALPAR
jgi:cytochrome oxidase Cu insertion factor (SCO1/SenC/PrrC family)